MFGLENGMIGFLGGNMWIFILLWGIMLIPSIVFSIIRMKKKGGSAGTGSSRANGGGVYATKTELKLLCKGKTETQKKAIEYFCKQPGCLSKVISDDEYLKLVTDKRDGLNHRARALNKIGLDESEVSEIKPAMFQGFVYKNAYAKQRADGKYVSSAYQVSWLFFSSTQVYIYRCTFHMDDERKNEGTDEFFYKDVTSFSTDSATESTKSGMEVESNKFFMVVPGDKLEVSMDGIEDSEAIIQAMKQKLREKKM